MSLSALVAASLAGCAPAAPAAPTSTPAATGTPSPTPMVHEVVIGLDGLTVDDGAVVSYDDADAVIAALTDALGAPPTEAPVEGPYGSVFDGYDWAGLKALKVDARIGVTASANGPTVTFTTPEGLGLGSTREEAMAAGAEDEYDEDGDGVADYLKIGMREVPGTSSLVHPGEVGVEYIALKLSDDKIVQINSSGNDFSDI